MNSQIAEGVESKALDRQLLVKVFDGYLFDSDFSSAEAWTGAEETLYHQMASHIEHEDRFSKYVPSAPTVLVQLMGTLTSETADFQKIQDIIKADPGLTGQIVKVSNSPLYRPNSGEITSIDKAIAMLGFNEIAQIASAVMMKKVFQIESQRYKKLVNNIWKHCQKSAEACLLLAQEAREFRGYLLGLVHDIGRISILSCFIAECSDNDLDQVDDYLVIARLMNEYGSSLSTYIAGDWGLDEQFLVAFRELDELGTDGFDEEQYMYLSNDTKALDLGSRCAIIHALSNSDRLSIEDGVAVLMESGLSLEVVEEMFSRFDKSENSLI